MYRVIMHNEQGAVLEDEICETIEEIRDLLDEYCDPENISLRVYEDDCEVDRDWYIDNGFIEESFED